MGIIIAIIVFSIVILFHELGHFLLAKKNGVGVTEFALGMGPTLFSFKRGETVYALKALPLGGSCAMIGEDTDEVGEKSFNSKRPWQRFAVIAAGPIFNFIMAFIFSILLVTIIGYDAPVVYEVSEGGPAAEAGIQAGDMIKEVNGKKVHMYKEFRTESLMNTSGKTMEILLDRDGQEITVNVTPTLGEDGYYHILLYGGEYQKTGVIDTLKYGVLEVRYWITTTVKSLGKLITGQVSPKELSGPVGIVNMMDDTYNQAVRYGWMDVFLNMLNFCILLSANLGVMNLLPIPALDGGRLFFILIELVRGKPVPPEKEGWVHTVGFGLLMVLMVFILYNDIQKLI
ncbi:MAG: RIP metalloprotease RseP [Clostridia bacterium]|nr:RIP metalloprotease RseP [Lachnospiraceae bacterium]NCC00237.1 RIP metalloprotease RseP [Clostridia bacterium]NCD02261.1 RIP metalloprotease RseP [Clostridia bacterium]